MISNYLKIAWRNLTKNKVFSLINILGLTIGITVCLMIFLFIQNEFSVDRFHKNRDHIYRVMREFNEMRIPVPYLSVPYATALLNDYPNQIKTAVRVMPTNSLVTFGTISFNEKKVYATDPAFFRMFSFPLLKGDPATALKDPASVVITEATAGKYFGKDDPMGKTIMIDKNLPLKVTGVAKNVPSNSHLYFDLVYPIANYANADFFKKWMSNNLFTYVQLNENVNPSQLVAQFPRFLDKYMSDEIKNFGSKFRLTLTPLPDIYFEDASAFDNVKHGDKKVVYIFLSIAVLILLIACINFTNLSTIRAVERSKEVGLRKVMGAMRNHLVWQFIGESILLTTFSCVLSVGILKILMPFYNQLLGYSLTVSWNSWSAYLFLISIIVMVGFLAGSYPAIFLSGFSPIEALKGKLRLGKSGSIFRQGLVVIQFSISVLLIVGTIIIYKQMHYIKNKSLGYDQEQAVIIPLTNDDIYNNRLAFKHELESKSNIASVSLMSGEPGGFYDMHNFKAEGRNDQVMQFRTEFADFEYANTLGLKMIAGRNFSASFPTDSTDAVLINRAAAAKLGWTPGKAIGKWIKNVVRDEHNRRIIGVVEDFNFLSLKEKMDGLIISPAEDRRVAVIKLKPGNISSGLETIKTAYSKIVPAYPFEYSFLDQKFDEIYRTDLRQQTIISLFSGLAIFIACLSLFSGLAIFIACLGLFGLASFTTTRRVKEIGVRKVLGSSTQNIVMLLSKDLLKPVIFATLIAMPVGYYSMNNWLQTFAYRTELPWWVFLLAAIITLLIALFTVSFKAIKAAFTNPAKSLRTE